MENLKEKYYSYSYEYLICGHGNYTIVPFENYS